MIHFYIFTFNIHFNSTFLNTKKKYSCVKNLFYNINQKKYLCIDIIIYHITKRKNNLMLLLKIIYSILLCRNISFSSSPSILGWC